MFTIGTTYLCAGNRGYKNQAGNGIPEQIFINSEDTIKTGTTEKKKNNQETEFIIPNRLTNKTINFEVNSDISYFCFSHFVENESKKMFFQAWMKEKELTRILVETDSLRKAYINSANSQKEDVSFLILKNEERAIGLNHEIPILYQNARDQENRYWQSATADEIAKFQEKIRLYKDSVKQIADQHTEQTMAINKKLQDTITYYKSSQKEVVKTDVASEIIYKIQVGAYKGKIPENAAKSIKKLSIFRKVENYKDEKGVTIYTTGRLKNYKEAVTLQNQVKQEGIKNAAIAAFRNGKKITVIEARKLNNEL